MGARPRIVIVGSGFGGLFAARTLERAAADLTLIDRNNYHLFQPLLYQVASAALAPADISQPIRTILRGQKNLSVALGDVTAVNLGAKQLTVDGTPLSYDFLILAPGAVDNYFGHETWPQFAPGMKQLDDATRIRSRLLLSFEAAELERSEAERRARLTFVIIGGGPTGVELAGAIKELAVDVIPRDYRYADTRNARVVLLEAGPRLLAAFQPDSSARAERQLQALGVEVRVSSPVTAVDAKGITVGGERIASYNVIWAAGVRASALTATLGVELGPGGRVPVNADCSIAGHPEAFVIGDAAHLIDARAQRAVPGVSQAALQMGRYVARLLAAEIAGRADARRRPFRYADYGSMATIGKSRAVVELGHMRFGGLLAWLAWMTLHITVLIGFRNRIAVIVSWIYSYVFYRRGSRLITGGGLPSVAESRINDAR
jgi:NADH dehydrogenase